ncbi:HesB/YadR/YfhF-family protein [Conexibacter sp. CPCC 206217]|uniref:HesB/YadR/YfhF-family protein n=1 Tax=Conexibacter sp. CPCC 206217 TaxID=3064574 RepID=UPI002728F8F6|nr:HesB/YadR/YfhF-family protein [Conexibacter sp. CPCC 206217]MDO8213506.1 HesB/YadR/YfhF-family protein [Conexibacter sp. CPCC 206217]
MLTITENAAEAIRGICAAPEIPDGAGIRIATQPGAQQPGALEVTVAEVPADSDHVLDEAGARVFVEDTAAQILDDKMLDAQIDGQRVGFYIGEQP